jgi:hypothetical protein
MWALLLSVLLEGLGGRFWGALAGLAPVPWLIPEEEWPNFAEGTLGLTGLLDPELVGPPMILKI